MRTCRSISYPPRRSSSGVTLIELLLVVFIILLVSAVAVPSFIKSFKGQRLRTSARTIVMASRYARSTAVLHQKQTAILFDRGKQRHELEVVSIDGGSTTTMSPFLDLRADRISGDSFEPDQEGAGAVGGVASVLIRLMEEGVRIDSFELERDDQVYDDIYFVNYYRNGMCDAFSLRLIDEDGRRAKIKVDAISGKVKVDYD